MRLVSLAPITPLFALLLLVGCKKQRPDQETGPSVETGWFTDSSDSGLCIDRVLETAPEAGDTHWYWRDAPEIITTSPEHDLYEFRLLTSDLVVVPTTTTWSENGLNARVELPDPLQPAADYQLEVTDCTGSRRLPFTTADYGLPLDGGPASLKNRTWVIDLTQADWIEPAGFGTVLALYFTTPVLVGAERATPDILDLLGAQGYRDDLGTLHQSSTEPTWDFPAASFVESPYFAAEVDRVEIVFSDVLVVVTDFALSGTFSADGTRIGGGRLSGLGDTRHMGVLVNEEDNPSAICDLAANLGAVCEPCPDGLPYCLGMAAEDVTGVEVPELKLEPRE